MKPIEGRLQTAEHILAKILLNKIDCKIGVCKFQEDYGTLEIHSERDIRELGKETLQKETQDIIDKSLDVKKELLNREQASQYDLSRVPDCVAMLRIIKIGDFDARPCKDPHVKNTKEIGTFSIDKIKKVGQGRFRVYFSVS